MYFLYQSVWGSYETRSDRYFWDTWVINFYITVQESVTKIAMKCHKFYRLFISLRLLIKTQSINENFALHDEIIKWTCNLYKLDTVYGMIYLTFTAHSILWIHRLHVDAKTTDLIKTWFSLISIILESKHHLNLNAKCLYLIIRN